MSAIHVAIPVLKGRSVFTLDKGRAWSAVEHALLEVLANERLTSTTLAHVSGLPRRVVVEVLTRLMRAGWVELSQSDGMLRFGATQRGRLVASRSELPAVLERISKPISYVIELISGNVFRKKEWIIRTERDLDDLFGSRCVRIDWPLPEATLDANDIISALLNEDETFVNAERSGTARRFAVVSVRDGLIDGLPSGRDLSALKSSILEAAASYKQSAGSSAVPHHLSTFLRARPMRGTSEFKISFSPQDLILDGPAHRNQLVSLLKDAKDIAIIHSTFISAACFFDIFSEIKASAEGGTRVHIFWGQNEELDQLVSSQAAISEIMAHPEVIQLGDNLTIHPFSTGSHAKFLVADTGSKGGYVAVVGSCNWLTSGFTSFDASVRLTDPEIVNEIVSILCSLTPVRGGDWTKLSTELVHLRHKVGLAPIRGQSNSVAEVVLGPKHSGYVLRARDESSSNIVVVSHRLGAVASPSVLVPLSTAAAENGTSAHLFYARRQRPISRSSEAALAERANEMGVGVRLVESPRIHAKFLAWDFDNILITSLNWLSADPTGGPEDAREVGIFIKSTGIANSLIGTFYNAIDEDPAVAT